jgi:hypothetical protein
MGITNALNNRPVRVLGFISAIHSFIYGFGYITAMGGFTGTVLYVNFGDKISTQVFGVILLITGSLLAFAYSRNNPKTVRAATIVQTAVWLFATMMYLLNGAYLLALGISLPWVLLSSYIAFAFARRVDIMAYDRTPQARADTRNEDKIDD